MAIFHLHVSTISRSAGRTATAAAAYRLGEHIHDDRTGLTHDYRRRAGVLATGIVGWNGDHGSLWNAAEAAEKRGDARTAREVLVALPHELTTEQQARLLRGFALHLRDRYGVAASWSLHAAPRGGDERNRHGHILMTTRVVDDEGRFGPKTRALDDKKTGAEEIETIRAAWEQRVNRELARTGATARISGRRRGVEPMEHLGPQRTALERRGVRTRAGDRNRARAAARFRASQIIKEMRKLEAEQATPIKPVKPPTPRQRYEPERE
jgi:ATP-dependent exoDNAse (exonuclease V) alpha subunit